MELRKTNFKRIPKHIIVILIICLLFLLSPFILLFFFQFIEEKYFFVITTICLAIAFIILMTTVYISEKAIKRIPVNEREKKCYNSKLLEIRELLLISDLFNIEGIEFVVGDLERIIKEKAFFEKYRLQIQISVSAFGGLVSIIALLFQDKFSAIPILDMVYTVLYLIFFFLIITSIITLVIYIINFDTNREKKYIKQFIRELEFCKLHLKLKRPITFYKEDVMSEQIKKIDEISVMIKNNNAIEGFDYKELSLSELYEIEKEISNICVDLEHHVDIYLIQRFGLFIVLYSVIATKLVDMITDNLIYSLALAFFCGIGALLAYKMCMPKFKDTNEHYIVQKKNLNTVKCWINKYNNCIEKNKKSEKEVNGNILI